MQRMDTVRAISCKTRNESKNARPPGPARGTNYRPSQYIVARSHRRSSLASATEPVDEFSVTCLLVDRPIQGIDAVCDGLRLAVRGGCPADHSSAFERSERNAGVSRAIRAKIVLASARVTPTNCTGKHAMTARLPSYMNNDDPHKCCYTRQRHRPPMSRGACGYRRLPRAPTDSCVGAVRRSFASRTLGFGVRPDDTRMGRPPGVLAIRAKREDLGDGRSGGAARLGRG